MTDPTLDMLSLTAATVAFTSPGGPVVRAVDGVTLAIPAGQFVVVVGTNGSGKSTLLGAIAGTVALDAGRIELSGRDITRWSEHRRAALVGRVFQDPRAGTAGSLSVLENIAVAARRGLSRRPSGSAGSCPASRGGSTSRSARSRAASGRSSRS
jgi:putative ABC transport system ATP-binding protein